MTTTLYSEQCRPERTAQEQMTDLLPAVANHEIRALTIGVMEPDRAYGLTDLRNAVLDRTGSRANYMVGHSTIKSYCLDSFVPIGLVATVYPMPDRLMYGLTQDGATLGKSLAGHFLDLSLHADEQTSLRRILGMTHSPYEDERPPFGRYEIYKHLLGVEEASVTELFEAANSGDADYGTITHRVEVMGSDGIISSELRDPRGAQYEMLAIDAIGRVFSRKRTGITLDVNAAVREVSEISPRSRFWTREVYDYATQTLGYPDSRRTYNNIKVRLGRLVDGNVLQVTDKEEVPERWASIEPTKVDVAEQTVRIIDRFVAQEDDILEEGLEKMETILVDSDAVKLLIEKGAANSPQATSDYAKRMGKYMS